MKEKDCKIVQDLLPNYIEKLTNDETNKYIEEHLKECEECKKIHKNMKKKIQLSENKKDNREVKYIKKYSNKMKILKAIILAILTIYILIIGRRLIIMYSITKKAEVTYQNTNYHARVYNYNTGSLLTRDSYVKNGVYLTIMTKNNTKHILYKNGNDQVHIIEQGEKRLINTENVVGAEIGVAVWMAPDFVTSLICWAPFMSITSGYCNGKDVYIINDRLGKRETYVDKETGLWVREIQKSDKKQKDMDSISDYEYIFNVVQDSDIVKPEITGNEEWFN